MTFHLLDYLHLPDYLLLDYLLPDYLHFRDYLLPDYRPLPDYLDLLMTPKGTRETGSNVERYDR